MWNRLLYLSTQPGLALRSTIIGAFLLGIYIALPFFGINSPSLPSFQPDLAIVSFTGPSNVQSGQDIGSQIVLLIENLGYRTAYDVVIDLYLFDNNTQQLLEGGRVNVTVPLIEPGKKVLIPLAGVKLPPTLPSGAFSLKVVLDPFKSIPETDESNNEQSFPLQTPATGL